MTATELKTAPPAETGDKSATPTPAPADTGKAKLDLAKETAGDEKVGLDLSKVDEPEADGDAKAESVEAEEAAQTEKPEDAAEDADADEAIDYDFSPPEGREPYRDVVIADLRKVLEKHKAPKELAADLLQSVLPTLEKDYAEQQQAFIEHAIAENKKANKERFGKQLGAVDRLADKAIARFMPEKLSERLESTPLWSDPDWREFLAVVGQMSTNDRSVTSTAAGGVRPDQEPLDELEAEYAEQDKNR